MDRLFELLVITILLVSNTTAAPTEGPMTPANTATTTQTIAQTTPSTDEPIGVVTSRAFKDYYGDLYIVGEVANNTAEATSAIKVIATLYDANDKIISTETTYTYLDMIPAGGKAPFSIWASNFEGFESYTLLLETFSYQPTEQVVDIASSRAVTDQYDNLYIVGEIQNPYDQPIESVEVVATLYDGAGGVINLGNDYVDLNSVMPGEKAPFSIYISDYEGFETYALSGEAYFGEATEQNVTIIGSSAYVDDYDTLNIVGEVQNDTDSPLASIGVVAALYDEAGQVLFVDNGYVQPTLLPGEKGPFAIRISEFAGYENYTLFSSTYAGEAPEFKVDVTTSRAVETAQGDMYIYGVVENNNEVAVAYTYIIATLYDEAGNVVNLGSTSAELDTIPANGTSPFAIYIDYFEGMDSFTLMTETSLEEAPYSFDLAVIDSRAFIDNFGTPSIVGEVENQGEATVENIRIIATIYDDAGEIISVRSTYAELDSLDPGEKSPFDITVYDADEIGSYELLLEAY